MMIQYYQRSLDVTGAYLRNGECAQEEQQQKEVEIATDTPVTSAAQVQ